MKNKSLIILLCSLLCSTFLAGQLRSIQSYSVHDGLAPGIVNVVQSDSLGYLWIGCKNGLSRFDGRSFRNYFTNSNDSTALPATEIYSIYPGKNGNIWLGTVKGLVKYNHDSNTFETWDPNRGLTSGVIKKIVKQNDSILWVGHWHGLDRINLTSFEVKNIAPFDQEINKPLHHLSRNHIRGLKVSPFTNEVYASHRAILSKYDEQGDSLIQIINIGGKSKHRINDFEWIDDNRILILTNYETHYFIYNLKYDILEYFEQPNTSWIRATRNHKNEIVILDSHIGPLKWVDQKLEMHEFQGKEKAKEITYDFRNMNIDRSGDIWCAKSDGIERWVTESTELFKISSSSFYHTEFDEGHNIGVSLTYGQPMCWKYKDGKITTLNYDVSGLHPHNIVYARKQKKFISIHDSFITIFHPKLPKKTSIDLSKKIHARAINYIVNRETDIFISLGKSIIKIDDKGLVKTIVDHTQAIFNILVEHENSIYFSCIGTLYHFDGTTSRPIYSNSAATRSRGLTIIGDTSLWFTEMHLGLVELNLRNYNNTIYGSESGLFSQTLSSIKSINNNLLIPGSFCFYNFDIGDRKVKEVYTKNKVYGSNHIANDIIRTQSGFYLVTVDQGIIVEPPKRQKEMLYDLDISYIQEGQGKKDYQFNKKVAFNYDQNDIFIKLDACYFGNKEDLKFSYSTSIDPIQWVEVGNIDEFNFLDLQPNVYNFSIKAEDVTGQIILKKSVLAVEILPPYWKTAWFRLLILSIIALIIYCAYKYRIKNLKQKYELDKKMIQLENNALKSQMNPHFLFNSLNGIRTLIKLEESEKASTYISYLSKMLRDTLSFHKIALVPLDKELNMSENYLQLAKLRFGNKLNWKINVDKNVNINSLKVPPFILQPLLENAIWHGIKHINTAGLIEISITKDSQFLYLTIEDNGIGLEASSQLQVGKVRTREHIGVKLVEKRLIPIGGKFKLSARPNKNGVRAEIKITINEEV